MKKEVRFIIVCIMIAVAVNIAYGYTTPEGPTNITIDGSSRRTPAAAATLDAIAGNITTLNIEGTTVTQSWQGYAGNISGSITLDDSSNHTLYSWMLTEASGEIYASSSTIDFSQGNIECYNFSRTGGGYLDLAALETSLGLESTDSDGVNETFVTGSTYDAFYAGTNLLDSECPETQLFNSSGTKSPTDFQEVLLYDLTANQVIYTAILEPGGVMGFNNKKWDFEMIVGENGHLGDESVTQYYFYVELE